MATSRSSPPPPGGFEGFFFNDSDVYKVLEGAAYAGLDITAIVEDILAAQQPDGYLNTYFILHPELERWNDMGLHEDYCLGHMIEAAIGMAMFNQRMFLMDGQGAYADLVELEMYNGILSGISLEGDRFFYDNPLASPGNIRRKGWFSSSCCPTSLCRWIPSIAGYIYASGEPNLYINQYIASRAAFVHCGNEMTVTQETDYPYDGRVLLRFSRACQAKLRIPGWCGQFTVTANGRREKPEVKDGYIALALPDAAQVQLELSMPVRVVRGNPRSAELRGRVAFARGPVVYCAESCDQPGLYPDEFFPALLHVHPGAPATLSYCPQELDGIIRIHVDGLSLIPYYAWANRTPCAMTVFLSDAAG